MSRDYNYYNMQNDFYFTLELTSNEHSIVEFMIREACAKQNIEVLYYRRFKNGNISCQRECKIMAPPKIAKKILKDLNINPENYHAAL